MTQAGIEIDTKLAQFRDRLDQEPKPALGNIPADGRKTLVWRLDLEPRHLVAEGRAYVSALAHGRE
ncbi:MAG TPA: hypothetical protein VH702_15515 [Vicinamibacterales bacterium]|jgi:hypothetical protein